MTMRPAIPKRLLLVNPNTSVHITERLARSARAGLPAHATLTALTASEGPRAVRSPTELAAAGERVRQMAAAHAHDHDAVIVGISLDCGVAATRVDWMPRPVVGMTEAACLMAAQGAPRFVLLTVGANMAESYRAHAVSLGWAHRLAGVAAPEAPEAFDLAPDEVSSAVVDRLLQAVRPLCGPDVGAVVLAGAVLCGYAPVMRNALGMPVFDGAACAVELALAHLRV